MTQTTEWWHGPTPNNKFAPKIKMPIYSAIDGTQDFVSRLTEYVLDIEKNIIAKEGLVSEVPKNTKDDMYQYTQQWKQHNLVHDVAGLDGEHLERFPENPVQKELFNLIRTNYLTFLADLHFPRVKVYINAWANILTRTQWISKHNHMSHADAYLAGTYYLTTNKTHLYLENPLNPKDIRQSATVARKIIFFPSYLQHWSDSCDHEDLRISIAFDLTIAEHINNPWRPHVLLDDPATMPGLDGK